MRYGERINPLPREIARGFVVPGRSSHVDCVPRADHAALFEHLRWAHESNRRLATEIGALRRRLRQVEGP